MIRKRSVEFNEIKNTWRLFKFELTKPQNRKDRFRKILFSNNKNSEDSEITAFSLVVSASQCASSHQREKILFWIFEIQTESSRRSFLSFFSRCESRSWICSRWTAKNRRGDRISSRWRRIFASSLSIGIKFPSKEKWKIPRSASTNGTNSFSLKRKFRCETKRKKNTSNFFFFRTRKLKTTRFFGAFGFSLDKIFPFSSSKSSSSREKRFVERRNNGSNFSSERFFVCFWSNEFASFIWWIEFIESEIFKSNERADLSNFQEEEKEEEKNLVTRFVSEKDFFLLEKRNKSIRFSWRQF